MGLGRKKKEEPFMLKSKQDAIENLMYMVDEAITGGFGEEGPKKVKQCLLTIQGKYPLGVEELQNKSYTQSKEMTSQLVNTTYQIAAKVLANGQMLDNMDPKAKKLLQAYL